MTAANKILLEALEKMIHAYNTRAEGINYTDLRDLQEYCLSKGLTQDDFDNLGI